MSKNIEEKQKLKQAFEDVIWMAIRYADGRKTYAPSMVRRAVKNFKEVFPDWEPKIDETINHGKKKTGNIIPDGDYLYDLFINSKNN